MSGEKAVLTAAIVGGLTIVGVIWLFAWAAMVTQREINEYKGDKK